MITTCTIMIVTYCCATITIRPEALQPEEREKESIIMTVIIFITIVITIITTLVNDSYY